MQTGMCKESISSYWYHVLPADVHSPWTPHPFTPPFQHTKYQRKTGWGNDMTVRRTFRWQQMEHTEVFWLGQTLSSMTRLGGLVLPPSVGTS